MKTKYLIIIVGLILFAGSAFSGVVEVELREEVRVSGETVKLGELARISGGDRKLWRTLAQLEIDRAPQPGQSRLLRKSFVIMKLRQLGLDPTDFNVSGSKLVRLESPSQEIRADELLQAIREDYFQHYANGNPDDFEIDFRTQPRTIHLSPISYKFKLKKNSRHNIGMVNYEVKLYQQGEVSRTLTVALDIRRFAEVVVAVRPIESGEILSWDNLAMERKDVTFASRGGQLVSDPEAIVGNKSRGFIQTGKIITRRMLRKNYVLKYGDMVNITLARKNISIQAKGEAMEQGAIGDTIRVRIPDTKRILHCKVINGTTVTPMF